MSRQDRFYQLVLDYQGFKKGTILLKGGFYDSPFDEDGEVGQEWFDLTTELATGHSYSVYNVPSGFMVKLPVSVGKVLDKWFQTFYDGNYASKPIWTKTTKNETN